MNSIRALIDDLPTESLDLFILHYESKRGVGGYAGSGMPWLVLSGEVERPPCPRCALGFTHCATPGDVGLCVQQEGTPMLSREHPAFRIEMMALGGRLNLSELYTACVLSLMERDGATVEVVERETVGAC